MVPTKAFGTAQVKISIALLVWVLWLWNGPLQTVLLFGVGPLVAYAIRVRNRFRTLASPLGREKLQIYDQEMKLFPSYLLRLPREWANYLTGIFLVFALFLLVLEGWSFLNTGEWYGVPLVNFIPVPQTEMIGLQIILN